MSKIVSHHRPSSDLRSGFSVGNERSEPLRRGYSLLSLGLALAVASCNSPYPVDVQAQLDSQTRRGEELDRRVESLQRENDRLEQQVQQLGKWQDGRAGKVFAPAELEILPLSSAVDTDGRPGPDAIRVHFRPVDEEGNVIPTAGTITVQVLDTSRPGQPRSLGSVTLDDPDSVRQAWHGHFIANQFSIVCPTEPGAGGDVLVEVSLTSWMTGRRLSASRRIEFNSGG